MKRIIAIFCILCLCTGLLLYNFTLRLENLANTPATTPDEPDAPGQVRFVNPDPSLQEAWEAIAAAYTEKSGTVVQVIPAAQAEGITPTLFTVDDEQQLEPYADVCLDLAGVNATHHIQNWSLALYSSDNKMCGLPLQAEGYGLIYNDELLRKAGVTAADITSFTKLKEVVQNIAGNTSLKFAPFACLDMDSAAVSLLATVPGDIRQFWDLYTANTVCESGTSGDDSHDREIQEGKAAFCIGSTQEFGMDATMSEGNLNIMPLYIGSENDGLCIRVESYLCVRSDISQADIDATLDFLDYLIHPQEAQVPVDSLGIFTPYSTATYYSSPLEKTLREHIQGGKKLVVFSNLHAPEGLAAALEAYAGDPTDANWEAVSNILQ